MFTELVPFPSCPLVSHQEAWGPFCSNLESSLSLIGPGRHLSERVRANGNQENNLADSMPRGGEMGLQSDSTVCLDFQRKEVAAVRGMSGSLTPPDSFTLRTTLLCNLGAH